MAVQTFPMPLTDFFSQLPIATAVPDLGEALEMSQTGAGEILTADFGPRLWKMDVLMRVGSIEEIERLKAKLNLLRYAGRSLLVHSIPFLYPQSDPLGAGLVGYSPTLDSVSSDNRSVQISLPPNYKIKAGDFFSFQYGSNPVRYAMHQFVQDVTSNGAGVMAATEVVPFIRPGWAASAAVQFAKPVFKAIVVPGSTDPGSIARRTIEGLKFSVMQTLR